MKTKTCGLLAFLALFCAGCLPETYVLWSPDGKQAVVRSKGDFFLCNADGRLSKTPLEDVKAACWYPDSKHVCLLVEEQIETWKEAAKLMTAEQRNGVQAEAPALLKEILAYEGDWNKFQPKGKFQSELAYLLVFLRETQAEALQAKVSKDEWTKLQNLRLTVRRLRKMEVQNGALKPKQLLLETLDEIGAFRLSPDGRMAALLMKENSLAVLLPDGRVVPVAERTALFPDFSADGKFIVYCRAETQKNQGSPVGCIARRPLCDDSGKVLKEIGKEENLAGVLFHETARVRCLKDGRILFSSMEAHLPATTKDMPQGFGLFALDPRYPTVIRMIPREAQTGRKLEGLDFFELSPDQTRIAILEDAGKVSVMTLATGDIQAVQDKDVDAPGTMIPVWRTNDDLCFVVPKGSPDGSEKRAEVVLKSLKTGQTRCLSKSWPDEFVEGWLFKKETPTTQPASAPTTKPD